MVTYVWLCAGSDGVMCAARGCMERMDLGLRDTCAVFLRASSLRVGWRFIDEHGVARSRSSAEESIQGLSDEQSVLRINVRRGKVDYDTVEACSTQDPCRPEKTGSRSGRKRGEKLSTYSLCIRARGLTFCSTLAIAVQVPSPSFVRPSCI